MAAPSYRVQVWSMNASTFGPQALVAEFEHAKNLGWANYLNDVPEAFFTLHQDDPKISLLRSYAQGNAHVRIYRDSDLVFGGFLGEWDANHDDAIIYAYGYLAALFFMQSDWATIYTNQQLDYIVSSQWTRAKTGLSNSLLNWVTTGTIQAPVTTSGGATPIVLPTYQLFYKRILFTLRELATIAMSDTTNNVVFEITPSGTFNFWKMQGTAQTTTFRLGDGKVADYGESNVPIFRRNDLLAVGNNPNSASLREEVSSGTDMTNFGRRSDPVFFSWVRDSVEMDRTLRLRLALALRNKVDFSLRFYPNALVPPGATGAPVNLADTAKVIVDRGVTNISGSSFINGVQVLVVGGKERVKFLFMDRGGS